jgi:hypothetical protein
MERETDKALFFLGGGYRLPNSTSATPREQPRRKVRATPRYWSKFVKTE